MFIVGVGVAAPPHRYTQRQCWDALQEAEPFAQLKPRSQAILRKVLLGDNGIATRCLALNPLREAFQLDPDALHARFATHGPALATQAAQRALASCGVNVQAIDAVLISTCTGYLCPGLTSYVVEQLGLRPHVLALDFVGQGCGAAIPNLRAAEGLIASGRCECVLSVCVEVCSAAFYLDNDPGVLVSACLFGDGAGAVVLASKPHPHRRRVRWRAAESVLSPAHREILRFEQKNGMLRNILSLEVPKLAGKHAQTLLDAMLQEQRLAREHLTTWILHAGGRDVLAALCDSLKLQLNDLKWSAAILRDFGNVSSASVLFALEAALIGQAPGGHWWMCAFGAGFSCHGALLEVD